MKAALVVFFAVVAVSSASVLPLGLGGLSWGAPWGVPAQSVSLHHPAIAVHAGLPAVAVHSAVPAVAVHAAVPAVAVAPVAHGAVSVNANRGSVHVAPLPGHAVSSSQLNLAPAPGTW